MLFFFNAIFLSSCQSVTFSEMIQRQAKISRNQNEQQKSLYVNLVSSKDKIVHGIVKGDFRERYSSNKNWVYIEVDNLKRFKEAIDSYLVSDTYGELLLFGHGGPFSILIGNEVLTKRKLKKLKIEGSLAKNGKIFIYGCAVGQSSMYQFGEPFVRNLGRTLLKKGGTVLASTRLITIYQEEFPSGVAEALKYKEGLWEKVAYKLMYPIYQYLTWAPWDSVRIREIEIKTNEPLACSFRCLVPATYVD